jgi:hypothetical protein
MPVRNREAKMLLQRFAVDDLGGIIMFESEGIRTAGAFVTNRFDFRKMRFGHGTESVLPIPTIIQVDSYQPACKIEQI